VYVHVCVYVWRLLVCLCSQLRAYLSGEDPSLIEMFPELATFRDLTYLAKAMMAPHENHLPELRAWTAADARLTWKYKEAESKEKPVRCPAHVHAHVHTHTHTHSPHHRAQPHTHTFTRIRPTAQTATRR
jgi:hypothetical protein